MKTNLLFDTNIVIDYLNGLNYAKECIENCEGRFISVVSQIEILCGVAPAQEKIVHRWLSQYFEILMPEDKVVTEAVKLRRIKLLKLPDTLILATARAYNLTLCTRDSKDFGLYPNVFIVNGSPS